MKFKSLNGYDVSIEGKQIKKDGVILKTTIHESEYVDRSYLLDLTTKEVVDLIEHLKTFTENNNVQS